MRITSEISWVTLNFRRADSSLKRRPTQVDFELNGKGSLKMTLYYGNRVK